MATPIAIAVIGTPRLWREAFVQGLEAQDGILVIHSAPSLSPDDAVICEQASLIVWGADFDDQTLRSAIECLATHQRLLVLGIVSGGPELPWQAVREGRLAWLKADTPLDVMVAILHRLSRGQAEVSPQMLATLCGQIELIDPRMPNDHEYRPVLLTAREHAVASLIAEGLINKQIARRLNLRISTVKTHVKKVMRKLDVQRRGDVERHLDLVQRRDLSRAWKGPHRVEM